MAAEGLKPKHVEAHIVYVKASNEDNPLSLQVDGGPSKSDEQWKHEALEALKDDDVLALGMVFIQYDAAAKGGAGQLVYFPHQFMGLSERGIAVLRKAAAALEADNSRALERMRNVH
jgi:hypothetical protein